MRTTDPTVRPYAPGEKGGVGVCTKHQRGNCMLCRHPHLEAEAAKRKATAKMPADIPEMFGGPPPKMSDDDDAAAAADEGRLRERRILARLRSELVAHVEAMLGNKSAGVPGVVDTRPLRVALDRVKAQQAKVDGGSP